MDKKANTIGSKDNVEDSDIVTTEDTSKDKESNSEIINNDSDISQSEYIEEESETESISEVQTQSFVYQKLNKLNEFVKGLLGSQMGKFGLIMLVFLFFALPILLTILGFDNIFIRSSIEGNIVDTNGTPISNANIKLQGQHFVSNNEGYVYLDNLDYGRWDIEITKEGFQTLRQEITINRFNNKINFEIIPLDYGTLVGLFSKKDLITDQLEIKINDQLLTLTEDNTFKSDKLITGDYRLLITSPFYKDIDRQVTLVSGENNIGIVELFDSADIIGGVYDFLNTEESLETEIYLKGISSEIEGIEDSDNFIIKDVGVAKDIEIKFIKDGYKEKVIKLTTKQGENSLNQVLLVPKGKIVSQVSSEIIYSDYDGENSVVLNKNLPNCKYVFHNTKTAIINCNDYYYQSSLENGNLSFINNLAKPSGLTTELESVIIENTSTSTVTIGLNTIFESQIDENIIDWTESSNGNDIFISTDKGIYKTSKSSNSSTLLTKGLFYLEESQNENILTLNPANSALDQYNIWLVSQGGDRKRLTEYPGDYKNLKWISEIEFTFIHEGSLKKMDISSSKITVLQDGISNYINNVDSGLITTTSNGKRLIINSSGSKYELAF